MQRTEFGQRSGPIFKRGAGQSAYHGAHPVPHAEAHRHHCGKSQAAAGDIPDLWAQPERWPVVDWVRDVWRTPAILAFCELTGLRCVPLLAAVQMQVRLYCLFELPADGA